MKLSFLKYSLLILLSGLPLLMVGQKAPALVSGKPLPNGTPGGIGQLALPFYNGYNMGTADVNGDGTTDLFLQGSNFGGRGIYLYTFRQYNTGGVPVFSEAERIEAPFEDKGKNRGIVFQDNDGTIYGIWGFGRTLHCYEFDKKARRFFNLRKITVSGISETIADIGLVRRSSGAYFFLFAVRKKGLEGPGPDWPRVVSYTPEGFWPYQLAEAGIYGAASNHGPGMISSVEAGPLTDLQQTYFNLDGFVLLRQQEKEVVVSGSRLGNLHCYQLDAKADTFRAATFGVDAAGNRLRNPNVHAYVSLFRGKDGRQGVITTGEGGIYFYASTGSSDKRGNIIFGEPVSVLQENPELFGGSLVVPNLIDWDGDGVLDLVSGTSTGKILFFKNRGTDKAPAFTDPVALKAGGHVIHIQPGYREDIQGPGEARWGYSCPTVTDWNGDGLPDILTGDSRGKFCVYLNRGTKTTPRLEPEQPLFIKGMNLFGSWRVRPAVASMGGRIAYVIMDQDDDFHLYWREDDYNVSDGGKLRIGDSMVIHGARLQAGAVGRSRIELVDWDGDGVRDLIVGTYGKQSIPEPVAGLPFHLPKRGSAVLFLRNTGTEIKPVFAYPKVMHFRGNPILLGGHECAPTTARIGPSGTLNLLVGEENGRYIFYDRKDLSW